MLRNKQKKMSKYDKAYWDNRYEEGTTGWDIGYVSTPIKEYVDQLKDKEIKVLIPGAGNAYEAAYMYQNGFKNIFVLDISSLAIKNFKRRQPGFPSDQLIEGDFFQHSGKYDLIIEQTFFCAIDRQLRSQYVEITYELLNPGGRLVGLLWAKEMRSDAPPFGGSKEEYVNLFKKHFNLITLDVAYNSIKPRQYRELFLNFMKQ